MSLHPNAQAHLFIPNYQKFIRWLDELETNDEISLVVSFQPTGDRDDPKNKSVILRGTITSYFYRADEVKLEATGTKLSLEEVGYIFLTGVPFPISIIAVAQQDWDTVQVQIREQSRAKGIELPAETRPAYKLHFS